MEKPGRETRVGVVGCEKAKPHLSITNSHFFCSPTAFTDLASFDRKWSTRCHIHHLDTYSDYQPLEAHSIPQPVRMSLKVIRAQGL